MESGETMQNSLNLNSALAKITHRADSFSFTVCPIWIISQYTGRAFVYFRSSTHASS